MINQIALTFIFLVAIVLVLAFTELVYRRLGISGELTRKFAHISATLSTVTFPFLFTSHWYVLVLALFFFVLLFVSRHGTQLRSIHDIARKSVGSYLLPLSIYITFLISYRMESRLFYILPITILAICDPVAGIMGMNIKKNNSSVVIFGRKLSKTWLGSGSFFVSAFFISVVSLYFYRGLFDLKTFWLSVGIALASSSVELFSYRGNDNLLIPLSVILMLVLFL